MATNAQKAYEAAAIKLDLLQEVELTPRATAFYTWLEAQPHTTAILIGNAQASLVAAAHAYDDREGVDPVADVLNHAAQILSDINGHATGQGS